MDASNRRVGKVVNGVLQAGYLYDGRRLVAQLNGSNQLVSQFVYGSRSNSPDYMIQGRVTYRIFSDQLGSPRLVVSTTTGAIAERIDYDEFGNVVNDTNAGFQPFGFAGGLYDHDTKLVRFGARDYSPSIGRWTAKDPILFAGGDSNLYGYVVNDPINLVDPTGRSGSISFSLYAGIGGGISITYADGHMSFAYEIGVGVGVKGEWVPQAKPFQGDFWWDSQLTLSGDVTLRNQICRVKLGVKTTSTNGDDFGPVEPSGQVCAGPACLGTSGASVRSPTSPDDQGIGTQATAKVKVEIPLF